MPETPEQKAVADILFSYLYNLIYNPRDAVLEVEHLPDVFNEVGRGLIYIGNSISEMRTLAKELSKGNLNCPLPPPDNEIASPLKMLHSSLRHLTWQTQQVAKGDYKQRVDFMGDFSVAFNNMVEQLEQKRKIILDEKTKLEMYVHLILLNCPNPILMFDKDGRLSYVSESCFRYCRTFKKEEIIGKKFNELLESHVSEQSLENIMLLYTKTINEKRIFKIVEQIDFANTKSFRHFEIQMTPMLDTGSFEGIIVFLFDINKTIQARHDAEYARDLAEQSSRAKSTFLAKMSHEIRTPMNAILGMTELALRENVAPAAEAHLLTIKQAGINLLSIINDILDFSKIEAGKLEIIPIDYTFSSLINDVINIIKTRMLETRLRFITFIDCNIPNALHGDSIRIRQILLNLLSNAVKYTDKGFVSFSITGERTDDETEKLIIKIIDSGKGIKTDEQDRLFTEFSRFDIETNRTVEGTGLGLVISQSLVMAMGGKIEVKSEYGSGSTFTVILPQKVRHNRKLAVVENPEKKQVLIYERRTIYANSIAMTMENLGVKYKIASDASAFHNYLISKQYPFIILASALYEDINKKYSDIHSSGKFAVIAEFGEAITDLQISTLTTPIYSLSVANFLNGISSGFTGKAQIGHIAKLTAPDAKVLVVDDIDTNLEVAKGLLQPYRMKVTLCRSGREAIEEIELTRFDLVLMDHMMPEMDGVETVSKIREMGKIEQYFNNVPIVALTADAVLGTREMLLKNGFDDFLSKPIDTMQLSEIIEKWIPGEKQKTTAGSQNQKKEKAAGEIKLTGVNARRGIALAGGKIENYYKILSVFFRDGEEKIAEINICLKSEDYKLYVVHVHALKSACAIIGAGLLSDAAAVLEDAGKRGDFRFIVTHNATFIMNLKLLLQNINEVLSDKEKKEQKTVIDKKLLLDGLSQLRTALINYDSPQINHAVNSLQQFTHAGGIGDSISEIIQNRLSGEYDGAVSIIDSLIQKLNSGTY